MENVIGYTTGHVYACVGVIAAFIIASVGSTLGVGRAGRVAGALLSKDPSNFSNLLVLELVPTTQSIYSFIVAFLAFVNMGILSGTPDAAFTTEQGLAVVFISLPVGIVGLFTALLQSKVAIAGMDMCVKHEKQLGRAMIMAAVMELFIILAFVASLVGVMGLTA